MRNLSALEASVVAGVGYKSLDLWTRMGLVVPAASVSGTGNRRAYDFRGLVALRVVRDLRRSGASANVVAKVAEHVELRRDLKHGGTLLPPTWIASDGVRVIEFVRSDAAKLAKLGTVLSVVRLDVVVVELRERLAREAPRRRKGERGDERGTWRIRVKR